MGGCLSRNTHGFDPAMDMQDLTGKVAIVTGANTGIGYHTAKFLARKGARVYMGARNESKAMAALAQLKEEGISPGEVIWLKVDFSDPRWALEAAQEFLKQEKRLDILVNNAAQLLGKYELTPDGINSLMIINHFSPFVFTRTLLPLLKKTAQKPDSDVRIITLASIAHTQSRALTPNLSLCTLGDFNQEYADDFWPEWARYSVSKLANLLFARELQKQLDEADIPILSIPIHPGEVNTFADRTPWPVVANLVMELFFMRPEAGSFTSCFAAASPKVRKYPGFKYRYLEPVGWLGEMSENAKRADLSLELWESTERILEDLGIQCPDI